VLTRFYIIDKTYLVRVMFSVLRSVLSTGVMMSHGPNAERDHSEREWSTTESSGAESLIQGSAFSRNR
jgi:hypothetical protein